jgi:hypothetical protein
MKPAVTPWFNASIKPMRDGWYECFYGHESSFQMRLFRGGRWLYEESDVLPLPLAAFGTAPGDQWRGLAEESKS